MSRMKCCLVCSDPAENENTFDSDTLKILGQIVNKTLPESHIHSTVLCESCTNDCNEYEELVNKTQELKSQITGKFKNTLSKLKMDYNTYPLKIPSKDKVKRYVVPASKLQPLPPDLVLNVSNILSPQKSIPKLVIPSTSLSPIKIKPIVTTTANTKTSNTIETTINNTLAAILNRKETERSSNIDYISSANISENKNVKEEADEEINNEEQGMEIDEDCTLIHVTADENNTSEENNDSQTKYYGVNLLTEGSDSNNIPIIGNLQILDEEDQEESEETIVMAGENGSILRIMSGQKLVYENGEITLASEDETSNHDDNHDHDSNEESQIELQVSGDEETANAIIAAAQERGGAFIKVESGEMYRVKSVHSKVDTEVIQMVEKIENGFKCVLCNKDPLSELEVHYDAELMMQHLRQEHNARIYICRLCNHVMRRRTDYFAHANEVHGGKTGKTIVSGDTGKLHECTECKKKYNSRTLLQEHMNMHSGTRPYICQVCAKAFASKYTHQAHMKTHLERPRPFKCKSCPKTFFTKQNLIQHEKTHLGIKDFVCKICDKAFGTQHNLEVHGVVHSGERPFRCSLPECRKSFARRAELRDHARIHTGERPFTCSVCGAAFSQRSNLHSHRRATHMDDRRYHCDHAGCNKKFKRRRLLDYHIKASHTGERPLQCAECMATFVYPEHYKKHARIHSGEKPFVCEVCGKSFNSRDNRNTHRFVHSDKKPYECLVCGAGYMRKQLLYVHMNSSGHLAESIVVNQPRVHKVREKPKTGPPNEKVETFVYEEDVTNSNVEGVLETDDSSKIILTADKKLILQDGNLVQEADDPALLSFIQNLENGKIGSAQEVTGEQLENQVQMVTADENGEITLVQININGNPTTWTLNTTQC